MANILASQSPNYARYSILTLPCDYCGAGVKWVTLLPSGHPITIDPEPLTAAKAGRLVYRVNIREHPSAVRYATESDFTKHCRLYIPHQTTCPNRGEWREGRVLSRQQRGELPRQPFDVRYDPSYRLEDELADLLQRHALD